MNKAMISPWLYNYIKDRGGIMNVTVRPTFFGWWNIAMSPSGLMGKPENEEDFEKFIVDDIVIYIDKGVFREYIKDNKLLITIEGYGRYTLEVLE